VGSDSREMCGDLPERVAVSAVGDGNRVFRRREDLVQPRPKRMARVASARPKPALEVAAVDDPEHVEDTIPGDHVVHDTVVANTEAVKRVGCSLNRPYSLATDTSGSRGSSGKPLEASLDSHLNRSRELQVGARSRGRKHYLVRLAQLSSRNGRERPFRYASRAWRRIATNSSAFASTRSSASSIGMITAAARPRLVTT